MTNRAGSANGRADAAARRDRRGGQDHDWFKAVGDAVKPGENLFEIETDKVSMEVPATSAGVLAEIRVPAGEVAPVGAVVAVISDGRRARRLPHGSRCDAGAAVAAAPPPRPPAAAAGAALAAATRRARRARRRSRSIRSAKCARPSAITGRRGCRAASSSRRSRGGSPAEAGHRSRAHHGSGPHGRIVARDIEAAKVAAARRTCAARQRRHGPRAEQIRALYRDTPHEEVPLDSMRKTIAARLVLAKQTIPHFYLTADVEIGAAAGAARGGERAAPKDRTASALKLSVNDFIIKAWALALQRVPAANAVWAEDRILRFKQSDIGVAVAIEGGLLTPVIRQAETKTLSAISAEMRDLPARARAKKLKPQEYQGGATAISNLGMYGVREFSAIINPPHATILAVGAAQRQAGRDARTAA